MTHNFSFFVGWGGGGAKNRLIKNIFEKGKSVIVEHYWLYFGQGEDFKLSTELS